MPSKTEQDGVENTDSGTRDTQDSILALPHTSCDLGQTSLRLGFLFQEMENEVKKILWGTKCSQ